MNTRKSRLGALALMALAIGLLALPGAPSAQSGGTVDPKMFQSVRWRNIGPVRGGRSIAASGVRGRRLEAYFGAVGGGLWKTTDGGTTWNPVTDGQIDSSSVGAVAVSESNPDVVYIGMGESHIRGNIMQGDGIYKSSDAGKTWTNVGFSTPGFTISRIRIHPTNPDIVYVAAFGNIVGPSAERGIYRTRDGGKTWQRVLFRDDKSAGIEIQIDSHNPDVLYASLWEAYRRSWQMWSGGPGSGLFKSTDAGDTWTEITRHPGLPQQGPVGKIGIAVSRADSTRVYVLLEHDNGGLFSSDDAGATWKLVNDDRNIRQRAFYYSRVYADPNEKDTVWMLNVNMYRSTDGGKTLTSVRAPHGDYHDLWIDPDDSKHLVNANDGGGTVSWNWGETWTELDFPTAQMYRLGVTNTFPYYACGGQQDNTTICVPITTPPGDLGQGYFQAGGGESGYVTAHPTKHNLFYSGSQGALITRFDRDTGHVRDIQPYPRFFSGEPASALPERWQWTFPIVFDPFDANTLYISSQHVWKTTDDGQSWERISPDLTRADPATLGDSGGPITRDMNGPEIFATVFAIGPSTVERGLIWTGSDDGVVQVTRDGGKSWSNVTPPGLGDFTRVSTVEPSPHKSKPGTAYVAGKRYLVPPSGDRQPYLFRTDDYGKTWTKVVNGIAPHHYTHSIREDPMRPGLLFAGTEHGVYVSFNDGENWQSLRLNMPDTQISDLAVKGNDLVVATHGRSFWVLENITTLRQLAPEVTSAALKVFEPRAAIRGYNRADVDYYLGAAADKVVVEILDSAGKVVRTFTGTPEDEKQKPAAGGGGGFGGPPQLPPTTRAGLNRFTWDLRYPGATVFPGMIIWSGNPANGPMAVPGTYQVRITAAGQTETVPLVIEKHPLWTNVTVADLQKQFELAIEVRDRTSDANETVIRIRDIRTQIQDRIEKSKNSRRLKEIGDAVMKQLTAIEEEVYQVRNRSGQDPLNFPIKINNRLASLRRSIETGDNRPTDAAHEIFKMLSGDLARQEAAYAAVEKGDLANFNKAAASLKLEPVAPKPIPRP